MGLVMLSLCHVMQVPPFKKSFTEVMPYVDFLFGNESEAVVFAESEGWATKDITEIAGKVRHSCEYWHRRLLVGHCSMMQVGYSIFCYVQIARLPKESGARGRTVVITQGPHPTVVASQGKVSSCLCYCTHWALK